MIVNFCTSEGDKLECWAGNNEVQYLPRIGEKVVLEKGTYIINDIIWISYDWIDMNVKKVK